MFDSDEMSCIRSSDIQNIAEQYLQIVVYDADRGDEPAVKTIVQEKRGLLGCVKDDSTGDFQ